MIYVNIGNCLKKILIENIPNFTICEVVVIAVFEWLQENKYGLPHLTVSYLHVYKINYNNNNTYNFIKFADEILYKNGYYIFKNN